MERIFVNLDELEDKRRKIKVLAAEVNNLENEFSLIRSNLDWDIRSRDNIDEDMREISRELDNIAKGLRNSSSFLYEARTSYVEAERILVKKASKLIDTLNLLTKPIEKTSKTIQNAVKNTSKQIPPLEGVLSYNPKEYNPYVKQLQIRLNELGYTDGKGNKLEPDGRFGRCTLAAVNKYKEQNQLWNSGIYAGKVGNTTWLHLFENEIKAIIEDVPAKEPVIASLLTPYERMSKAKENLKKIGYGGFTNDRNWDPQFNRAVIDFVYAYGLNEKYYASKDVTEANNQLFDWIEQAAAGKIQPQTNQGIITVKKNLIKIGYTNLLLFDGWSEDYNKALWDFSDKYGCPEGLIQVNLDKEMVYKWIALAAEGKLLPEDYRGLPKATIDNNYGKESKIRDVCEYNTGKYGSLDDIVNALRAQPDHQKDKHVFYVRMYSSKDQCTYLIEYDYTDVKEGDSFEAKVYRETIDKKGNVNKDRLDNELFAWDYRSYGVLKKNGEILANIRFLAELRGVEDIIENKNSIVMNIQDADKVSEKELNNMVKSKETDKINKQSSNTQEIYNSKQPCGSIKEFKTRYGDLISEYAKKLNVDENILGAIVFIECGGSGFYKNGTLKIRFEDHIFTGKRGNGKNKEFFIHDSKDYSKEAYRTSLEDEWKQIHAPGKQEISEYGAFEFAKTLNEDLAYDSISMGFGQIMGFNHGAAGYKSSKEMFDDFSKSEKQQILGMMNFIENYSPKMLKALQEGDLDTFGSIYNGENSYGNKVKKNISVYRDTQVIIETKTKNEKQNQNVTNPIKGGVLTNSVYDMEDTTVWNAVIPKYIYQSGERNRDTYNLLIDQFEVGSNKRYEPRKGSTYCNIFAWDVSIAMGIELPRYVEVNQKGNLEDATGKAIGRKLGKGYVLYEDPKNATATELNANRLATWLEAQGENEGWREITPQEAQERANKGYMTISVIYKSNAIGHVQVIRPTPDGSPYNKDKGVYIAQAGKTNFNGGYYLEECRVSEYGQYKFYTHD